MNQLNNVLTFCFLTQRSISFCFQIQRSISFCFQIQRSISFCFQIQQSISFCFQILRSISFCASLFAKQWLGCGPWDLQYTLKLRSTGAVHCTQKTQIGLLIVFVRFLNFFIKLSTFLNCIMLNLAFIKLCAIFILKEKRKNVDPERSEC